MPRSKNRPGFRFGIRRLLVVSAIGAMTCAVISTASRTVNAVLSQMDDSYAADWTAEFLINHLRSPGNTWPSGWSELKDEFDANPSNGYPFTFDELQDLVNVQWDVDTATIANSDPPLKVITLARPSGNELVCIEPNTRIRDYFANASSMDNSVDLPK